MANPFVKTTAGAVVTVILLPEKVAVNLALSLTVTVIGPGIV
jgi:hypothetical protein